MAEAGLSEADHRFMRLALDEARAALAAGDYPVGAVLTVDGVLWGSARNSLFTDGRTTSHAEHKLLYEHSARLRTQRRGHPELQVCLYTTLEPCLMCLGISVMHRVSRLVVACPDPSGGTLGIDPATLGSVCASWWPQIQVGLYKEESCALILEFLKTGKFLAQAEILEGFRTLQSSWRTTS